MGVRRLADQLDEPCAAVASAARPAPGRTPARARGWPGCRAASLPSAPMNSVRHASGTRSAQLPVTRRVRVDARSRQRSGSSAAPSRRSTRWRRRPWSARRTPRTRPVPSGPRRARAIRPSESPMSHRYRSCGSGSRAARGPTPGWRARPRPRREIDSHADHAGPLLLEQSSVAVGAATSPTAPCTAASPQPAEPFELAATICPRTPTAGSGAKLATSPLVAAARPRDRAATWSRSRDVVEERGGRDEDLPVAGPARALARSGSRWGCRRRCRGSSTRRSRASRLRRSSLQRNHPVRRHVGVHDDAGDVVGVETIRVPLDAHVLEAVGGVARFEHLPARPAETTRSTWPAGSGSGMNGRSTSRCVGGDIARDVNRLPVSQGQDGSRGRDSLKRTHPLMFWPRSNTCPRATRRTDTGDTSATARTGGAGEATSRLYPWSATVTECQPASSKPELTPPGDHAPQIDRLARDQIGHLDVRPRAAPTVTRPSDHGRAVGKVDADLGEEAELRSPLVVGRGSPTWPRYHPSDRIAPIAFAPGRSNSPMSRSGPASARGTR